jgi:hypothetical protein
MRTTNEYWNADTLNRKKERIDLTPEYQRAPVWNEAKKQLLMDSILRGYDIPKIYLRRLPQRYEVVDGQQRLRSIWEFMDGSYPLGEKSQDLPSGDLAGQFFQNLSEGDQDRFSSFQFSIGLLEETTDLEIRDLFLRLQEGVSLNPAERRNAMPGRMRDFVARLAEEHPVFGRIKLNNKRYAHHDLVALVTCLEMAGGPADIKAPSLRKMYQDNTKFDPNCAAAKQIKKHLNYLNKVLTQRPEEMRTKWGFVDLYLLVSHLIKNYVTKNRESTLAGFFIAFETRRLEVKNEGFEELAASADWLDHLLLKYIQAFETGAGTRDHVEKRHSAFLQYYRLQHPDLVPLDPTRAFSPEERLLLWHKGGKKCAICKTEIELEEMDADHIVQHSDGGKTTLNNGRCLCIPCNRGR